MVLFTDMNAAFLFEMVYVLGALNRMNIMTLIIKLHFMYYTEHDHIAHSYDAMRSKKTW